MFAAASPAAASHGAGLPWAGGNAETSPFEARAAQVMTAGPVREPVTVHCNGDHDWATLAGVEGFDPDGVLGYVPLLVNRSTGAVQTFGYTHLSPRVCLWADEYWAASTKPGQTCEVGKDVEVTQVARRRAFWVTVRKRVRVAGTWRVRTVRVRRTRTVYVNVRREVPRFAPCVDYPRYVQAIETLAHEAMHLARVVDEATAECHAMQWLPFFATELGATPEQAREMAEYYWSSLYPRWQRSRHPEYWSPECRDGGALDLNLGPLWP